MALLWLHHNTDIKRLKPNSLHILNAELVPSSMYFGKVLLMLSYMMCFTIDIHAD